MSPEGEVYKLVENEEMGQVRRQRTLGTLKVTSTSQLAHLIVREPAETRAGELNVELPDPVGRLRRNLHTVPCRLSFISEMCVVAASSLALPSIALSTVRSIQ